MILSMSEILNKVAKAVKKEDKIRILKQHESLPLKNVLIAMYDKKKMVPLLPAGEPPYNANTDKNAYGSLFREQKHLKYLYKGWGGDNLKQVKREQIFIQMLETVHKDDARLLIQVINQEPIKGISKNVINEAYNLNIE